MTLAFTPEAFDDFKSLVEFLRARNSAAAERLAGDIFSALDALDTEGLDGPETKLISGERVRSWPVPPVRVYYQRSQTGILVVRVYHQSRNPITR
jgi:plasmid stabilization system protein ParE